MKFSNNKLLFLMVLLAPVVGGCQKTAEPAKATLGYENTPQSFLLHGGIINEASGIADSKANPGYLWVEEDSGNPPQVSLVGHDGKVEKTIALTGAINRDWEDMALAKGPEDNKQYLYIADIGDNNENHPDYTFYRFVEPDLAVDAISLFDKITFTYPDRPHDAEAFLVDGATKDIYVITKKGEKSGVYHLPYPQQTATSNEMIFDASLDYNGVVSAAQSADGSEIIIKTYTSLYYYTRKAGESITAALNRGGSALAYQIEPQGEAVAFACNNTGFFTLSEKGLASSVSLNFYKRK